MKRFIVIGVILVLFLFTPFQVLGKDYDSICFVGDSRTVGLKNSTANSSKYVFIAKESMGYNWFSSEAVNTLRNHLNTHSKGAVVFNFGINDIGATGEENVYKYISLYKQLEQEFPDTDFYYMTVNPVQNHQTISNSAVEKFNSIVAQNFPNQIIDTYSNINFQFTDTVHYQTATYRDILNYTEEVLKGKSGNIKEYHKKPLMTKLDPDAVGCKLFGDDLLDLLADIYHWIRGVAVAAVVILGIMDFIKAVVANHEEMIKKSGTTFMKRLLLLVILIMLPDLIDFVLALIFGKSEAGNCLEKF